MRKGQIEFIVVLGIIIVIAVVGFYALQTGMIQPAPPSPDVRLVQDSVNNFIRNAVYDTLRKVSDNGGYLEPQASGVAFMGKSVPYWMNGGRANIPDIQQNIISGVANYIKNNKDSFASSMSGKTVALGQPQASVTVLDNQLSVTVYMPTTVNGAQVPQPYVVSVPTKIGEVVEFSNAFAQQQAQNRYLEYFLISSMLISPYDGPSQIVPTYISLTTCGEFVFKSWWDVKPRMEELIKTTLAHTYMPDKYPMNVEHISDSPKYAIPEMSGKKHFDLNVSFDVPDGFSLTQSNFQMNPDPVMAFAEPIPMTGMCQSEPIVVRYYLDFPTIVRVKDALTGNILRFAMDTYIHDNMPGSWGAGGYNASVQAAICSGMYCDARVKVVDSAGAPVSGAAITYMGCGIGQTDSNGVVFVKAPCGYGALKAYKSGYDVYSKYVDSSSVANMNISMTRMPVIYAHLYESVIETVSGSFLQNGSSYRVSASGLGANNLPGVNPINSFPERPVLTYLSFQNKATGQIYERFFDAKTATISGIPAGEYIVSGGLLDSAWTELYGGFTMEFNITEQMDGKDIYIYFPYSYAYSKLADRTEKINGGVLLTSMLSSCGMGPVQTSEYNASALPCNRDIESL